MNLAELLAAASKITPRVKPPPPKVGPHYRLMGWVWRHELNPQANYYTRRMIETGNWFEAVYQLVRQTNSFASTYSCYYSIRLSSHI